MTENTSKYNNKKAGAILALIKKYMLNTLSFIFTFE